MLKAVRIFTFVLVVVIAWQNSFAQENLVGTFYGGWARNKGNYIWAKDHGQNAQMITVGDVDGDGYEDAVTVKDGVWEVALSYEYQDQAQKERRKFDTKRTWISEFGNGFSNFLIGDINGDGKDDIATCDANIGYWEFAISNGASFTKMAIVVTGLGAGSSAQFLNDVNGDGMADMVAVVAGDWYVRMSNGSGFDETITFVNDFGVLASSFHMADVTGDKRMDAIYVNGGSVYVAKSSGTSFSASATAWKTGLSYTTIMFADASGDKAADAIIFDMLDSDNNPSGTWNFYKSNKFGGFGNAQLWCMQHGSDNARNRPSKGTPHGHDFFTGYVQSPKGATYGVSPISFNNDVGYWEIMPPYSMFGHGNYEPGASPNWYCSWQYNNRAGLPRVGDIYYGFDANDDKWAILKLVEALAVAEIDFVMLDQTNSWGALLTAHTLFAQCVMEWNANPVNRKVRYAIAGQFKTDPLQVENSAKNTLDDFYYKYGTDNYQNLDGKPLLVCYGETPDSKNKDVQWTAYTGSKTNASNFSVKWMDGNITTANLSVNQDAVGDWYGWSLPHGTIVNNNQMVVQPGFYNGGSLYSRWEDGVEGDRYRMLCWDKVLVALPKDVTIISFAGDPEQNDVMEMEQGEFLHGLGKTEHWSYPEMYWEMTKDYIQNFRKLKNNQIEHVAEYGRAQVTGSSMMINFTQNFSEKPVVYACYKGGSGGSARFIQVTNIFNGSCTLKLSGYEANEDTINWFAVKPGTWLTPNGMKLAAGSTAMGSEITTVPVGGEFQSSPSLFSIANSNNNDISIITKQENVTSSSFDLSVSTSSGALTQDETLGWIAIETGKSDMWSGRFCSASTIALSGNSTVNFNLPRYFYDRVLTLVKSANGVDGTTGEPVVESTTNLGGVVNYWGNTNAHNDTLNTVCFDGAGGCLYGSPWISDLTSVNKATLNNKDIKIYPNPVDDMLHISCNGKKKQLTVEIINHYSGVLKRYQLSHYETKIDVSDLNHGLYILRVTNGQSVDSFKILKN